MARARRRQRLATAIDAVLTRETGGTAIGVRHPRDPARQRHGQACRIAREALLTAADRAQHFDQVVAPALAAGRHVVSDRSVYSALAYQGYGRMLDVDEVRRINDWALNGALAGAGRAASSVDDATLRRADARSRARPVRAGGRRVPPAGLRRLPGDGAADPDHWVVVDGNGSVDEVAGAVRAAVRERLGGSRWRSRGALRCGTASSASRGPSNS